MIKLLATLGLLFLLTSPASADHVVLENDMVITDYVILCATELDAKAFARSLDKEAHRSNELTTGIISKETDNHKCTYGQQTFTYREDEYVCGFSIIYHNFSILHTTVRDRIKEYMIVNATIDTDTYASCNLTDLHPM